MLSHFCGSSHLSGSITRLVLNVDQTLQSPLISNPVLAGFHTPIAACRLSFSEHHQQASSSALRIDHENANEVSSSVARDIFDSSKKKRGADSELALATKESLISYKGTLSSYVPPLLNISQISDTRLRFALEGLILNKYGTYKLDKDFRKYLKVDLVDRESVQTITLVVPEPYIPQYVDKLEPDSYVRVEGSVVVPKNSNDGASCAYSLHVDATTVILKAEPFDCTLVFMPELSIQRYLAKTLCDPGRKGTIAFVVLQVDKGAKSGVSAYSLTVADGPNVTDRATLSFINARKALYHRLVSEFESGDVVMYVARNIGSWKEKSNTLSILDITILTPVFGERLKQNLLCAFKQQIKELGYAQEVIGVFTVTNFNDSIVARKCAVCNDTKVSQVPEGGYCFQCAKIVDILMVPTLEGTILQHQGGGSSHVKLNGTLVDKVLALDDSFVDMFMKSSILLRVALSEVEVAGKFSVDTRGHVIAFEK